MTKDSEHDDTTPAAAREPSGLAALFGSFLKIGAFTFGGGWAMIPLIQRELVLRRRWLQDSEFVDLLAVAQSAPGPVAVNTAVITGLRVHGVPGALVAALGACLPSFFIILALATVLARCRGNAAVEAVFMGMRPAILGLLVSAVWQVGKSSVKTRTDAVLAIVAVALLLAVELHPIAVVAMAAVAGVVIGKYGERAQRPTRGEG